MKYPLTYIATSGGTDVLKYYYDAGVSVAGHVYTASVWVFNVGSVPLVVALLGASAQVVAPASQALLNFTWTGDGSTRVQLRFQAQVLSQSLAFYASTPSLVDRNVGSANLIPSGNQTFTGWTAYLSASVSVSQTGFNLLTSLPAGPAVKQIDFSLNDTVGEVVSPFTRQTQEQEWPGADWWEWNCALPPIKDSATAQQWEAFFMQTRGKANVFQMGNPLRVAPRGLGIARGGVNLLLWSEAFANAAWIKQNGATVAAATAPDGTPAFIVATSSSGLSSQGIYQSVVADGVSNYIFSIYAGSDGGVTSSAATFDIFDATAGVMIGATFTKISGPGSVFGSSVISLGAVATRVSVRTATPPAAGHVLRPYFYPGDATATTAGTSVYGWHPQLEQGSGAASAYVGTSSSSSLQPLVDNTTVSGVNLPTATRLYTRGWSPNLTGLLLPGDGFNLGLRLHCALESVISDANGLAVFSIWPSLREQPPDGSLLVLNNPVGLWRNADNKRTYSVDKNKFYAFDLKLREAR